MANATWKQVPGFPGLWASSKGEAKREAREVVSSSRGKPYVKKLPERVLAQSPCGDYLVVFDSVTRTTQLVHRLVCLAFHGVSDLHALHRNDKKHDNEETNLYWGTRKQNAQDAIANGTMPRGVDHGLSKLTEEEVLSVRRLYVKGDRDFGAGPLSRRLSVSPFAIRQIVNNITWTHLTGV